MVESGMEVVRLRRSSQGTAGMDASERQSGFTLIELIGVLAVISILAALTVPNVIRQLDRATRDAERHELETIAEGVMLYVREHRAFPPSLAALSPGYVPLAPDHLIRNPRGYRRYLILHPALRTFRNAKGLGPSELNAARFLVISHLGKDAAPRITTASQFDAWWTSDESARPDLKIHRAHIGHLFRLLRLSATGNGGSYRIDGRVVNSHGGILADHQRYHLVGTSLELDEASVYAVPELVLSLLGPSGFRFDPDCAAGRQWQMMSSICTPS